jgi:uncharacterized protein (DUF58 family)
VRNEAWLVAGALLLLIGAPSGSYPVATLGLLLLTAVLIAKLWARYSLRALRYERSVSPQAIYAGERATLELTLTNAKPLALPWVIIEDQFDPHLIVHGVDAERRPGREWGIYRQVSVGWYQRLRMRYEVECPRRGYHQIGPAILRSGDPFGLYRRDMRIEEPTGILVYPRLVPVQGLNLGRLFPFEAARTGRGLLDDPLNIVGARPYAEGDTLRQVHWRASARSAGLQSKVLRPTTEPGVLIFLDLASAQHAWQGVDVDQVEHAISTAATVAHRLRDARLPLGLYVNGLRAGTRQKIRLGLSRSDPSFQAVMDTLARVYAYPNMPIAALLRAERRTLPAGATVVLITAVRTPELDVQVELCRRARHHVELLDLSLPDGAGRRTGRGLEAVH